MLFTQIESLLRRLSRRPGPHIVSMEGRLGLSPLSLALDATRERRRIVFVPPALTDGENRMALRAAFTTLAELPAEPPSWPNLLRALPLLAPVTLIIDEPATITGVAPGFWQTFGEAWRELRRERVHLIFTSRETGLAHKLNRADSPLRKPASHLRPDLQPDPVDLVQVRTGTHYDLADGVRCWTGQDLLTGWALFGGLPARWASIPKKKTSGPAAALRAALEDPDGPWISGPEVMLESAVSKTNRYASVLSAIAHGAKSRKELSAGLLHASGNRGASGPYLNRLHELGLIEVDRPLRARPGSRRSRYRIADPHEVLWWSALHPRRSELVVPGGGRWAWRDGLKDEVTKALSRALPEICRNFLIHDAERLLGATAREAGPLWGNGFDFSVVATLRNGAVCYGYVHRGPGPAGIQALDEITRCMRKTRFGFGREKRLKVVFSLSGFSAALSREVERERLVRIVGAEDLAPASD